MNNSYNFKVLISKYHKGECSEEEKSVVESWLLSELQKDLPSPSIQDIEAADQRMHEVIQMQTEASYLGIYHLWPRIVAAAVAITVIGSFFYLYNTNLESVTFSKTTERILPGKNGATLKLSSGIKIDLTSASTGVLAKETGVKIIKSADGQLIYEVSGSLTSKIERNESHYNTLTTARGEQYQVRLPDSSIVWLNAASVLKFPTSFASLKYRRVELSGEAYFQVSKDKRHPFIVYSKGQEVKVLGTHFNVNSYPEEPSILTTLLEGSVEVSTADMSVSSKHASVDNIFSKKNKNRVILKTGQQSQISKGNISVINNIDLDDVMAWKEGYFVFNENLKSIMNKVGRWYNVEVIYKNEPDQKLSFQGKIARSRNLKDILGIMERTGAVNFKVEGRRVTITIN